MPYQCCWNARGKEIVVIVVEFNGHVASAKDYGSYSFGFRNKEGERIIEFFAAMIMTIGNTLL